MAIKSIQKLRSQLVEASSTSGAIYLCCVLFIMFLGGIMATDLYLPSLPHIASYFHSSATSIKLTITAYLGGYAVSQLIYGPLSDRLGRYPMVLIGMTLFALGTFGCFLSHSTHMLIAMRLLQGVGGGVGMCMSRTIMRDLYEGKRLAQVASYIGLTLRILPAVAPLLGGYIQYYFDWKTVFLVMTFVSVISLALVALLLPETNRHKCESPLRLGQITRTYLSLFNNKPFIANTVIAAVAMSGLFVYYTLSPFLLQNLLHVKVTEYAWLFLINAGALLIGQVINTLCIKLFDINKTIFIGIWLLVVGAIALIVPALFSLINKILIIAPMAIFALGSGMVMSNAMVNALKSVKKVVGSASSLFSSLQMLITGAATFIAARIPEQSQMGFALILLCLALAALFTYQLICKGKRSSLKSTCAYEIGR